MRKTEILTGALALIAFVMKLLNVPGADLALVISLTALATYYFILSICVVHNLSIRQLLKNGALKNVSSGAIIGSIGLGCLLSVTVVGINFKLMLYPGANVMLAVGLAWLAIALLIVSIKIIRRKKDYLKNAVTRIITFGVLGLVLYLIPKATLVDVYYRNDPEYAKVYKLHLEDPDNKVLWKQLDDLRKE